ncbi:hypothetical protein PO124_27650 [Bacillus licheniformis]|nr:hypothetical protein [Bacillus licheniformis]
MKTVPYSLLVLRNESIMKCRKRDEPRKMKALLHNQAIGNLLKNWTEPGLKRFNRPVRRTGRILQASGRQNRRQRTYIFQHKAEGIHLSVAAASIIARYSF